MNLLLAAHALGYVAGWVTGWRPIRNACARLLRPGERIAGFIFIGHPGRELEERPPAARDGVAPWRRPSFSLFD
jgi:nitroreductase